MGLSCCMLHIITISCQNQYKLATPTTSPPTLLFYAHFYRSLDITVSHSFLMSCFTVHGSIHSDAHTYTHTFSHLFHYTHIHTLAFSSDTHQSDLPDAPIQDGQDNLAQRQKLMDELTSLHTPCHAEFLWTTALQERAAGPVAKKGACLGACPLGVVMRGEWLEGEDRDIVHQIVQYLNNSMDVQ